MILRARTRGFAHSITLSSLHGALLIALWGSALGAQPATAASMTVQAPCSDDPAAFNGLRSCAIVLKGPAGVLPLLKQRVEDSINHIYNTGTDQAPLSATGSMQAPSNFQFGPTFCNLVPGPLNNNRSEVATNRASKSCGVPLKVVVHDRGRKIRFDASAPGAETLESGYLRGSYGAALSCFHTGIASEIEKDKKINVSPACQAMAQEIVGLSRRTDDLFGTIKGGLAGQANLADIANCINNGRMPGPKASLRPDQEKDVGPLRQSAQHLCAARLQLESMFSQLAVCEVFSRAGLAYQSVVALPSSRKKHSDAIFDAMVKACEKCDGARPTPVPGEEDKQAAELEAQGSDCVNRCYLSNLPVFLRQRFQGYWPAQPTSTAACRATPL
jgi:hypothetical protein